MKSACLFLAFCLIALIGCDHSDEASSISQIRLEPGTVLHYTESYTRYVINDPDSVAFYAEFPIEMFVRDREPFMNEPAAIRVDVSNDPQGVFASVWYRQDAEGLSEIARTADYAGIFAEWRQAVGREAGGSFLHWGGVVSSVKRSDSLIVHEQPLAVYRFPLDEGHAWTTSIGSSGIAVEREVVEVRRVTVEAGAFEAAVVQQSAGDPYGLAHVDYVGRDGLLWREADFESQAVDEYGETIGTTRLIFRSEMTGIERP